MDGLEDGAEPLPLILVGRARGRASVRLADDVMVMLEMILTRRPSFFYVARE